MNKIALSKGSQRLFASITYYLTDELLAQVATAAALPPAAARAATAAVPALLRQLAQPVDYDELQARWDVCRQLYLSQLLTQPEELLRTDLGWPERRRCLAQKMLGPSYLALLAETGSPPAQGSDLLGCLTVLALAVVGEQACAAGLAPQALGQWLAEQAVPQGVPVALGSARPPSARLARPAGRPAKLLGWSVAGGVATASLVVVGSGLWLGRPAAPAPPAAPPKVVAIAAKPPAPVAPVEKAPPVPAAAPVPAAPAPPPPPKAAVRPAARLRPAVATAVPAVGLRDTVGNAALARLVGGRFSASAGRYPKGEGQPLIIKLLNRATLTVGINSTESLLYKRLANPSLPRPADIPVDRLSFDLSQARLGAEGAQQLGNVANLLKTFPKARLVVVGHANNHEAQAFRLGLQRATAAVDELVKQGIAAERLQAQGALSTELPGDNDSAEKQAMLQGISLKVSRLSL